MNNVLHILLLSLLLTSNACGSRQTKDVVPEIEQTVEKKYTRDISDPTNTLTGITEILELEYIVWGCACANWVTPTDRMKYEDNGLAEHCIYIEPADESLNLPAYFDAFKHRIKVTGRFYVKPDYPKGTIEMEEPIEKAKVFRYTKIEIIEIDNKEAKN